MVDFSFIVIVYFLQPLQGCNWLYDITVSLPEDSMKKINYLIYVYKSDCYVF